MHETEAELAAAEAGWWCQGEEAGERDVWKLRIKVGGTNVYCLDTMSCLYDLNGPQPARLLCQRNLRQGKTGELGCHFLLQRCSGPTDRTCISCLAGRFLTTELHRKPKLGQPHIKWISNKVLLCISGTIFNLSCHKSYQERMKRRNVYLYHSAMHKN